MSWPNVALGDIFDIARGGSPRPIDDYITDAPDGVNWISIKDASNSSKYITTTAKKIRRSGVSMSREVKPGDFLLTNSMSFGRPYILRTSGCIHDGWLVLRGDESVINQDYFYHLLGSDFVYRKFQSLAAGAVVKNLNIDLVKTVKVPLPPLAEQRRIAAILDKADALRAKRREAITKLDQLLQSVFLDMFGDPVTNPKGWVKRELSEICDPSDRVNYGVVQPGDDFAGGVPLVRVGDIEGGHLDASSIKTIDPEIEAAYGRSRLKGSELLVSCVGSIGTIASVPMSAVGYNIARAITRVPLADPESRSFVRECLRTSGVQRYFAEKTRTVSQPTLNVSFVKSAPIICPPASLVWKFCRLADAVEQKMQSMGSSEVMTAQLFQSLQEQAFSGQLARNG